MIDHRWDWLITKIIGQFPDSALIYVLQAIFFYSVQLISTGAYMASTLERENNFIEHSETDPIAATVDFWRNHAEVEVSPEDAREMIASVVGFFSLLAEWESAASNTSGSGQKVYCRE